MRAVLLVERQGTNQADTWGHTGKCHSGQEVRGLELLFVATEKQGRSRAGWRVQPQGLWDGAGPRSLATGLR